jgi:hypothetical protein
VGGIGLLALGQFAAIALTGTIAAIWADRPSRPRREHLVIGVRASSPAV